MSTCGAEDHVFVCRCEEITKEEIAAAIADGATTVRGIKVRTEAGMGLCQGRGCRKVIQQMLSQAGVRPAAEVLPSTTRTPVRTAKISEFINEEDD
ncbi:MAG: (2Fe-2S)-binding protein [Clostridiales bacterium]